MLLQRKFFKRSKKFLLQHVDVNGNKAGKKKSSNKSTEKPKVQIQLLETTDKLKDVKSVHQPQAAMAIGLMQAKMSCMSEWNHPNMSNYTSGHTSSRVLLSKAPVNCVPVLHNRISDSSPKQSPQPSIPRNIKRSDHPAFRSSLYNGPYYLSNKSNKSRRLDIHSRKWFQNYEQQLQSIQEEEIL